jgi:hypothetical protein
MIWSRASSSNPFRTSCCICVRNQVYHALLSELEFVEPVENNLVQRRKIGNVIVGIGLVD